MPLCTAPSIPAGSQTVVALCTHAERTVSGDGGAVEIPGVFDAITFQLIVTAQTAAAGDSLDVHVQQQLDGANWDDVLSFTHLLNGDASQAQQLGWAPRLREAVGTVRALRDIGIAEGTVADMPLGKRFRAKWVIGGAGRYTFQVVAHLHRRPERR